VKPSVPLARKLTVIAANSAVALGYASGLVSTPAAAENWFVTPGVSVRETYTSNANLAPSGQEQSSFVTSATAAVGVSGNGARAQLNGSAAVTGQQYLGEYNINSSSNNVFVQANLLGSVEAIEKFFFVEGAVNVSQQYLNPFAPQPASTIGVTNNRYTAVGFRVSPYLKGVFAGGATYLLRYDAIWSNLGSIPNTPGGTSSYAQRWTGRIDSPIRTFGWSLDAAANNTKFSNQATGVTNQIVRGYLNYRPDPQVLLYGIGGYEWNNYYLTQSENVVYGVGGDWRPTERTNVKGNLQHRFFGAEYLAAVTHRNPYSAFDINASQNISTYPQQLFAAPAGGDLATLVNAAFITRVPDPVQRAQAVEAFLQTSGLPTTLQSPLNYYVQQVFLYEQQTATFTLLGVRNSTAFTVYNRKQEVISGGTGVALPAPFGAVNNNTQRGGAVAFSHQLTPLTALNAIATRFKTIATAPFTAESTTNSLLLSANQRLSPKTDAFTGVTYTDFSSNVTNDYTAFTVYVGLGHRF
jgi:uncharacterized protein (PEP-CTERM system associated)